MGFNIKNNYGPNIEVNDGGVVHLHQDRSGHWTTDIEEAQIVEDIAAEEVTPGNSHERNKESEEGDCEIREEVGGEFTPASQNNNKNISANRQKILDRLLGYADKGDWVDGIAPENVKQMLRNVLGQGEMPLSGREAEMSETLWRLLENGRGERVIIVWQNMVGYLDDKKMFRQKGSPALNKDFFGDDKGYTNIDKGRPSKGLMTADFESIIPLLDAYAPKVG